MDSAVLDLIRSFSTVIRSLLRNVLQRSTPWSDSPGTQYAEMDRRVVNRSLRLLLLPRIGIFVEKS